MHLREINRNILAAAAVTLLIAFLAVQFEWLRPPAKGAGASVGFEDLGPAGELAEPPARGAELTVLGEESRIHNQRVNPPVPTVDGFLARLKVGESTGVEGGASEEQIQVLLAKVEGGERVSSQWLPVSNGEWSGVLPIGEHVIEAVTTDNRPLRFEVSGSLSVANPLREVLIIPSVAWELAVTDDVTGSHLSGVSVYAIENNSLTNDLRSLLRRHKGVLPSRGVSSVVLDTASPVLVERSLGSGYYWVTADGYATQLVQHSEFQSWHHVSLRKAGLVDLGMDASFVDRAEQLFHALGNGKQSRPSVAPQVLLRDRENGDVVQQIPLKAVLSLQIELPASDYTVELLSPAHAFMPAVLFEQEMSILPGETHRMYLTANDIQFVLEQAPLSLVVTLPELCSDPKKWGMRLMVRPQGFREWQVMLEERLDRWDSLHGLNAVQRLLQTAPVGKYLLTISPSGHIVEFGLELSLGGRLQEVILDLSDLSMLIVRVEGEPDGDLTSILTYTSGDFEGRTVRSTHTNPNEQVELLVVPGEVQVQLLSALRTSGVEEIQVGANQVLAVDLDLAGATFPLCEMIVWDKSGHASVDAQFWTESLSIVAVGHLGFVVRQHFPGEIQYAPGLIEPNWSKCSIVLSQPGLYRIDSALLDRPVEFFAKEGVQVIDLFPRLSLSIESGR